MVNTLHITRGGLSAKKFRKTQIRKFEDWKKFVSLADFRKCDNFRFWDLRTQSFLQFEDLWFSNQFLADLKFKKFLKNF